MALARRQVVIPYLPRRQFEAFHARPQRWAIGVCHRRAGKSVACVNDLIRAALRCQKPRPRFAYLAPFFRQAKAVAWDYIRHYAAPIPGAAFNEAELRCDLPNGGQVRLYGADNYDSLRGIYLDGAVLDEYADMDPRAWSEVIRPALADRQGWAAFIGTPRGRNSFAKLWTDAQGDPEWFGLMLKASETGLIPKAELEDARRAMTPDQYAQEFECSFDAAVMGAYYASLIAQAETDKRIAGVPWDPAAKVTTAWDLGIGDSTAIWFAQSVGREVHVIDYIESSGQPLGYYAQAIQARKDQGWVFSDHILPHDAEARELGTGKTRVETLRQLGVTARVLQSQSVEDGINAARLLIPRCWFDKAKCADGLEALRSYRADWDETKKVLSNRPRHDWASHGADGFRYLAMGLQSSPDAPIRRRRDAESFMGV